MIKGKCLRVLKLQVNQLNGLNQHNQLNQLYIRATRNLQPAPQPVPRNTNIYPARCQMSRNENKP